jgi:predicted Na+-dependent transporter
MRLDPNPLFRRVIMPWYDSTPVCWTLLVCMVALVLFSIVGIVVALEDPAYRKYQVVPWGLAILSFLVGLSISMRLIDRRHQQHRDAAEP